MRRHVLTVFYGESSNIDFLALQGMLDPNTGKPWIDGRLPENFRRQLCARLKAGRTALMYVNIGAKSTDIRYDPEAIKPDQLEELVRQTFTINFVKSGYFPKEYMGQPFCQISYSVQ